MVAGGRGCRWWVSTSAPRPATWPWPDTAAWRWSITNTATELHRELRKHSERNLKNHIFSLQDDGGSGGEAASHGDVCPQPTGYEPQEHHLGIQAPRRTGFP